jgi:hypothetical protein
MDRTNERSIAVTVDQPSFVAGSGLVAEGLGTAFQQKVP